MKGKGRAGEKRRVKGGVLDEEKRRLSCTKERWDEFLPYSGLRGAAKTRGKCLNTLTSMMKPLYF